MPVMTSSVRDEEGHTCSTPQQQHERWRRHYSNLLNIVSEIDMTELEQARQRPPRTEMADPPSSEEMENAISKLRTGKAAGKSGILPEMVKAACGNADFFNHLLELATIVWNGQQVPQDWVDAVLIPISKKGDLCNCGNWRGIALLDDVGKVVATILQERLQLLAEQELPESQCGFQKGRSCTDMIFVVRQLMEKSWEHRAKTFFTFIDLKKAYDSVPRRGMWLALKKLGVPEKTVNLIRAFHTNMKAKIRLDGELLEDINVENGLRQGCCMAPVLFNLYTTLVIERWQDQMADSEEVGVTVQYKQDKKLFQRYTKNANKQKISECLFADDGALSVLLYGSECWTLLKRHSRRLDAFHHRCIRSILGITNHEQWTSHITSDQLRQKWGDKETATEKIAKRRLQWLGHLARMSDSRMPKKILFGWLGQP